MRFGNFEITYAANAIRVYGIHYGYAAGTAIRPRDLWRWPKNFHRQLRAAFRIWEDSRKAS